MCWLLFLLHENKIISLILLGYPYKSIAQIWKFVDIIRQWDSKISHNMIRTN